MNEHRPPSSFPLDADTAWALPSTFLLYGIRVASRACLAGVSVSGSRWPSQDRRLFLMVVLQGVNLTSFFKSIVDSFLGYEWFIATLSSLL